MSNNHIYSVVEITNVTKSQLYRKKSVFARIQREVDVKRINHHQHTHAAITSYPVNR